MGLFKAKKQIRFDIGTLKKNDIIILTLDERWNKLFQMIPISSEVKRLQDSLNKLLGQEAGLYQEQKNIEPEKRKQMNRIMALTQEAFEKNNEDAKRALTESKKRIEELNARADEVENELFQMKDKIREANFNLLEETVRYVYSFMVKAKEKEAKIQKELEQVKKRLKDLQEQRQNLATDWTDVYTFFHTLLGSEELTKLDLLFLKPEVEANEAGDPQSDEKDRCSCN